MPWIGPGAVQGPCLLRAPQTACMHAGASIIRASATLGVHQRAQGAIAISGSSHPHKSLGGMCAPGTRRPMHTGPCVWEDLAAWDGVGQSPNDCNITAPQKPQCNPQPIPQTEFPNLKGNTIQGP